MMSRGQLEIATLGSRSWISYAPQGVKGLEDDDNNYDDHKDRLSKIRTSNTVRQEMFLNS